MRLKEIDNPWLIKVLTITLTGFGAVVGAALGPDMVQIFNPNVTGTLDAYTSYHPQWYVTGFFVGGAFGLLLALGTLFQLKRQAEAEKTHNVAHPSPH